MRMILDNEALLIYDLDMDMKRLTCTVDPAFAELLEKAAARSGRSLCQFLRTALGQWAEEHKVTEAPRPAPRSRMGGFPWL